MSEFDKGAYLAERAERLALTDQAGWEDRDRISWIEHGSSHWLEIPRRLSLEDKLRCVDIYNAGREEGVRDGRYELQRELLDLLGAQRHE